MKDTSEPKEPPKKIPLLRKFDIPVDHVDFRYVETCNDAKEIERILRVLRSGEEGYYPDLILFVEERLKKLDPNSRVLRVEVPVLKSKYLDKTERDKIQNDLSEWIESVEDESGGIFSDLGQGDGEVPIRTHEIHESSTSQIEDGFVKKTNPSRIKSWEYDKWEKLDVDAELTRLEVTDMQINEWEKYQKPRIQKEEKKVEKFMKNEDTGISLADKPSNRKTGNDLRLDKPLSTFQKSSQLQMSPDKPSFIEEIPDDWNNASNNSVKDAQVEVKKVQEIKQDVKPRRKIRIQIDDVNIGY